MEYYSSSEPGRVTVNYPQSFSDWFTLQIRKYAHFMVSVRIRFFCEKQCWAHSYSTDSQVMFSWQALKDDCLRLLLMS